MIPYVSLNTDNYSAPLTFKGSPAGGAGFGPWPPSPLDPCCSRKMEMSPYSPLLISDSTEEPHGRTVPWDGHAGVRSPQPFHGGEHLQLLARGEAGPQHVLLGTVAQEPDAGVPLLIQIRTVPRQLHLRKCAGFRNVQARLQPRDSSRNWLVTNECLEFVNMEEILQQLPRIFITENYINYSQYSLTRTSPLL